MIEAFPEDTAPRWLLHDRDAIYGDAFRRRVDSMYVSGMMIINRVARILTRDSRGTVQFGTAGGLSALVLCET
jgi:hypothetical protein